MKDQYNNYQLNTRPIVQPKWPLCPGSVAARKAILKGEKTEDEIESTYWRWMHDLEKRCDGISFDFSVFLKQIGPQILIDESLETNRLFSPFSLFSALTILSILTSGNTQTEIYHLLGCSDIKELLTPMRYLLQGNCIENGEVIKPSSSLWFDDTVQVKAGIPDVMAMQFGSSSFSGNMKEDDYRYAATVWLNDVTGGQLHASLEKMEIKDDTVMLILTSMLLKAKWENKFNKRSTKKGIFHAATEDYECQFMHNKTWSYIWFADGFKGLQWEFEGIGCVWFLLPDEGNNPNDIIKNGALWNLPNWDQRREMDTTIAIPKFDLTIENEISDALKKLGVNQVFTDDSQTPFTKIDDNSIKLADVKHGVRLKIDEEGCTAAAYTVMRGIACAGIPQPPPKMDFILDRPFIITVYGIGNLPLFTGVVNRP